MPGPLLSVLVPVFDERERVLAALDGLLAVDLPGPVEVVLVDDGSTDGTRELLAAAALPPAIRVLRHERNRGKGAALRTALGHARGGCCAIFDADLEYDPADLPALLEPLLRGEADAVFGVRALGSHARRYALGNQGVTWAANALFAGGLRDVMTGQKVVRTDVLRALALTEDGFAVEAELTARLLQRGARVVERPARYRARSHAEGKKLTARDGVRVLATLVRCRVRGGGARPPVVRAVAAEPESPVAVPAPVTGAS